MFSINRNLLIIIAFAFMALNMAAPPPPDMWANTGATGEVSCYSCHTNYPLNDQGGYLKINTTPPITNGLYIPGQTYLVSETFTRPPLTSYQCSTEIIDGNGQNTGTMLVTDSTNTMLLTAQSGRLCLWAGYYDVDTLIHCTFTWVAPPTGVVSIYAAGVARDNLIGGAGGYVSTDSLVNLHPGTANAVNDITNTNRISLYPNPAKNLVHLKTSADEKILHYQVINANAQTIKTGSPVNGTLTINELPAGIYWLQCFTTTGKMQTVQFEKQ